MTKWRDEIAKGPWAKDVQRFVRDLERRWGVNLDDGCWDRPVRVTTQDEYEEECRGKRDNQ